MWEGCQGASSQAGWALLSLLLYAKSCPTLGDPMDGSLPGSSVHGIFQDTNIGVGCRVPFSFSPIFGPFPLSLFLSPPHCHRLPSLLLLISFSFSSNYPSSFVSAFFLLPLCPCPPQVLAPTPFCLTWQLDFGWAGRVPCRSWRLRRASSLAALAFLTEMARPAVAFGEGLRPAAPRC